jgi:hypothetical protein
MPEPVLNDRERMLADDSRCRPRREEYERSGLVSAISTHVR